MAVPYTPPPTWRSAPALVNHEDTAERAESWISSPALTSAEAKQIRHTACPSRSQVQEVGSKMVTNFRRIAMTGLALGLALPKVANAQDINLANGGADQIW